MRMQLSHSWGQALGSLTLPLRDVLLEPGMVLDRWFNVDGALPESQILLRVVLKVPAFQLCPGVSAHSGGGPLFIRNVAASVCVDLGHSAGGVPQGRRR